MKRFALISAELPPGRSGQAVILQRLLAGIEPGEYCLIENAVFHSKRSIDSAVALPSVNVITPATVSPSVPHARSKLVDFPVTAIRELYSRARQIKTIIAREHCQSVVICTGDFYDFPAAYLAAKWAGVPLYAYMFDDYYYQSPRPVRAVAWLWERMVLRGAAGIVVTNEFSRREYQRRHGVDATVIYNPFEPPHETPPKKAWLDPAFKNIVFAGTIYNAHYDAFVNLIQAIRITGRQDIRLNLLTATQPEQLIAAGIGGPMISLHGYRTPEESLSIQREADVLFLPLAFQSPLAHLLKTAAPGKIAEYLSMGKPVLVHAPADSFVSWYFREHDCGLVADENDPQKLAQGLLTLLGDASLGQRLVTHARQRAKADFDIEQTRQTFLQVVRGNRT